MNWHKIILTAVIFHLTSFVQGRRDRRRSRAPTTIHAPFDSPAIVAPSSPSGTPSGPPSNAFATNSPQPDTASWNENDAVPIRPSDTVAETGASSQLLPTDLSEKRVPLPEIAVQFTLDDEDLQLSQLNNVASLKETFSLFLGHAISDSAADYVLQRVELQQYSSHVTTSSTMRGFRVQAKMTFLGDAIFDTAAPLPSRQTLRDILLAYFAYWQSRRDLAQYLESHGLDSADDLVVVVDGEISFNSGHDGNVEEPMVTAEPAANPTTDTSHSGDGVGSSNSRRSPALVTWSFFGLVAAAFITAGVFLALNSRKDARNKPRAQPIENLQPAGVRPEACLQDPHDEGNGDGLISIDGSLYTSGTDTFYAPSDAAGSLLGVDPEGGHLEERAFSGSLLGGDIKLFVSEAYDSEEQFLLDLFPLETD